MSANKKKDKGLPLITNSKARHKFAIGDKYEAGIQLQGTEVKSIRSGNAQISDVHGNFVINMGGASAKDVCALIEIIREKVYNTYGFELEEEIQIV